MPTISPPCPTGAGACSVAPASSPRRRGRSPNASRTGRRRCRRSTARGLDFDTVHLLGLDDGTFPAPHAENPLWPDAMKRDLNPAAAALLRRKLGARGENLPLAGVLRTAREASLEDPFLFFLALSM